MVTPSTDVIAAPSARVPARRRAPALLWVLAGLAVVPAIIPIGLLVTSLWTPTSGLTGSVSLSRLTQLTFSTAVLVGAVTATASAIGMAIAWLLVRTDIPGRRMWAILASLPLVIPSYVGALTLLGASGRQGMLSIVAGEVGLGPLPTFGGFWAAWLALSLWNYPFVYLLVAPVLRRMDPGLEEAARGLGASRTRVFWTIIFPQLRPALAASGLLVALYTLSDFGAVSLLRYDTFTRAIYSQFRGRLDLTPALFLSGILVLIALVLVAFERRTRGRAVYHSSRPQRTPELRRLPKLRRAGALGFLSTVVGAALLLPAMVLGWWTVRGLSLGLPLGSMGAEAARSALVATSTALVTVAAAIPLAIITVRYRGRTSAWLESLSWATYSLPHIAVGLAFLVFALRAVPFAYQTLAMLVVALMAMFLPLALGATQAAIRRVGPNLEEASRSLGVGTFPTFRRILIPLISPGLVTGFALVFLTAMKELPATLILRPTGFETLAVRIWSATAEGFYTRASAASLLLLAISAVPLYYFIAGDIND